MYPLKSVRLRPESGQPGHVRISLIAWCSVFVLGLLPVLAHGQINVVTWHYNNGRTGANTNETRLTPANVGSTQTFGKLFSQPVDGFIAGQPLYLSGVTIPGKGVHNAVYVATNNDTVYAFDADSASGATAEPLWMTSILTYSPPGAIPVPITVTGGFNTTGFTQHGIISTPVIDPSTNTMYVVADTYENQLVMHRLHALDVRTGQEVLGGPTTIAATYTLNGVVTTFQGQYQMQRPGLLLANGHIYVGFGSNCCNRPPTQGWVMSYNATTLQQEGAYTVEPGANYAAIWQHGAALSADSSGYIYGGTGEGPYTLGTNLSESVFKLAQTGTSLILTDWFTPYNHLFLSVDDDDMADGVLVIPDHGGTYPHELVAASKAKTVYVLNRDNMGQLCDTCTAGDTQIVQEFDLPFGETGFPAYWNRMVYFTPPINPIQAYALNTDTGMLSLSAQSASMPGAGHPFVTSHGTSNGVLWTNNGSSVMALNAVTLQSIYDTNQAANQRDKLPVLVHFPMPIVANGKLFVGTTINLVVYGLLPTMAATGGSGQTGVVATVLPSSLKVRATDSYSGAGIPGLTVTFSDGGKGGSFGNRTGRTDATGTISTTYTLPTRSGSLTITATATGKGYKPVSLLETAVAGRVTALFKDGGSNQTAPVLTTLPIPLSVIARDRYSNAVPGVSVTFSDGGAGGSFSTNPIITNAQGLASVSYTTGTRSGQVFITASASGVTSNAFDETVTAGRAAAIAVQSGNNQVGPVSTLLPHPLVSKVTDQFGNPVRGVLVHYSDGARGGSFSANPVTTDSQGNASVGYTTPPTVGTVTIHATVSGVTTPATFTETAR